MLPYQNFGTYFTDSGYPFGIFKLFLQFSLSLRGTISKFYLNIQYYSVSGNCTVHINIVHIKLVLRSIFDIDDRRCLHGKFIFSNLMQMH